MNNNQIPENRPQHPEHVHLPFSFEGHYQPWYDDRRDYNTNAPSYYDYLAHRNFLSNEAINLINRVARRNIQVENTNCIAFTKVNDWIDEGNPCETWHDIITLKCDVILAEYQRTYVFDEQDFSLNNSIECLNKGLYSPDYMPILSHLKQKLNQEIADREEADNNLKDYIDNQITNVTNQITNMNTDLTNRLNQLETALQKIVDNLFQGGNATSNNINNYQINNHIAAGNINVYSLTPKGQTLIQTHPTNVNATGDVTLAVENNNNN